MQLILNQIPFEEVPYWDWLQNTEKNTVLLTSSDLKDVDKVKLGNQFLETHWFEKWAVNSNVEHTAQQLKANYNFTHVIAISEVDVLRAERILGNRSGLSMLVYRDKLEMKALAKNVGLTQPPFKLVSTLSEFQNAVEAFGLPMVIKPRLFGGSIGVHVLNTITDIDHFLTNSAMVGPDQWNLWIAEKFQAGKMIHIDGIVKQKKVLFSITSEYLSSCLSVMEGKDHGSAPLSEDNPLSVAARESVERFVEASHTNRDFVFHAEFFCTPEGLSFCEIAARPGGSRIREALLESTGWFDNLKHHVQLQAGVFEMPRATRPPTSVGWYIRPPKKGKISKLQLSNPPPGVFSVALKNSVGDILNAPSHSGDELVSCLFSVDRQQTPSARAGAISAWLDEGIEIDSAQSPSK